MDAFRIEGGHRLAGRITIDGSKNAALPMMAAALLADNPVTLENVPNLSDIRNMARLLGELGCEVTREPADANDSVVGRVDGLSYHRQASGRSGRAAKAQPHPRHGARDQQNG